MAQRISWIISATIWLCAQSQSASGQSAIPIASPTKPETTIQKTVQPTKAALPAGTAAPAVVKKAQILFPIYNDMQYRASQSAGRAVLLVFAEHGHPVWLKQAPVLQVIMRSADRVDADVFQVDITDRAVCSTFKVTTPGTILVMKDGMERLRSNGMVREAAIKKLLRLVPTL